MISFKCHGTQQHLAAGGWFGLPPTMPVFADTPGETLRRITRAIADGAPWREVLDREYAATQPWLHQIVTSSKRDLFFRTHQILAGQRILDVGSGWGQQALSLAGANTVCAVEPNADRLQFVRAVAGQLGLGESLYFLNANLQTLEFEDQFDAVTCIGVLEWAANFTAERTAPDAQQEFLRQLQAALKPHGRCIIGIENRLGLKYLLGARDDHTGERQLSCLDYPQATRLWQAKHHQDLRVLTHTRAEYERLLSNSGFRSAHFYAAYPDYKLPGIILPCDEPGQVSAFFTQGGFLPEHDGWNGSTLDETQQTALASHYRSLAEMGIAHHFAPSFFIVAHK